MKQKTINPPDDKSGKTGFKHLKNIDVSDVISKIDSAVRVAQDAVKAEKNKKDDCCCC